MCMFHNKSFLSNFLEGERSGNLGKVSDVMSGSVKEKIRLSSLDGPFYIADIHVTSSY